MSMTWQRYSERHSRAVGLAAAVLLFGSTLLGATLTLPGFPQTERMGPAVALAAVSSLATLAQRRLPRTIVLVTAVCAMVASAMGYLLTPLLLAPLMVALCWLAIHSDRRTTRFFTFGTVAMLVTNAVIADPMDHPLVLKTIGPAAWVLLPAAFGSAVRLRRAYMEAVQARAEHAERTREEEARHRVAEERMRIARELHDVVAHHLALANAQAGTVAHLIRTRPDHAEKLVGELAGTTSSALRELKATVGLLRQPDDPHAPLEPTPGLARLPELTASLTSAGLTVTVTTEGAPRPLSPGVDLTAFRIVQEALTNVTKHADTTVAHVRLAYSRDRLTVTVTDEGGGPTIPAAPFRTPGPARDRGFGLIGMRERAQSVGGRLRAGHRPAGGFEVTTELPLHPDSHEEDKTA